MSEVSVISWFVLGIVSAFWKGKINSIFCICVREMLGFAFPLDYSHYLGGTDFLLALSLGTKNCYKNVIIPLHLSLPW